MNDAFSDGLMVGLDVGSTTVKAVVVDPRTDEILWKDYERHETRQPQKVHDFLERIEDEFPLPAEKFRIFITGSGANMLTNFIGAKFVQEVNAVSLAVEQLYPEAGSVIELGGQDAKIIIWQKDPETGVKRKIPSMNDKCAGGTGAVIDKISAKLQLSGDTLAESPFFGVELHPVAGKCGVFAETDINGLQKQGIPSDQLMASLYEAIVQQNLSVLTRGNTLLPTVLLLGGPNTYIPALRDCWKSNIPKIWEERNIPLPEGVDPQDLILVPENAQYYAAIGSVLYGKSEEPEVGVYKGRSELFEYIEVGRARMRETSGDVGLCSSPEELEEFKKLFATKPFEVEKFSEGEVVKAFIGIDGGSTSTKAVLMDREGKLLATSYQLSQGNPLADAQDILGSLREQVEAQGATLEVMGVGTTGYAKDMLKESLSADVGIVETVAHTKSALHYYKDVDVIVDVGGQDIKVIILNDGKVKDFKLNTQCSAGNGYFLQSTAARFGYSVSEFADAAFAAERLPVFGYGCAVFMETDIVNFQQLGWQKHEIMAGLAKVLPKNIWLYVVAEPNLAKFGQNFVLQGGTQHNLAAVKSQYDFIKARVPGVNIRVHRYTGESGAIGAALEAIRVVAERDSVFIGIEAAETLEFTTTRDESTRCGLCKNDCLRTFIDTTTPDGRSRRYIVATCEKGEVENMEDLKEVQKRLAAIQKDNPNLVARSAVEAFRSYKPPTVSTIPDDISDIGPETDDDEGPTGFRFLPRFRFGRSREGQSPQMISPEVLELRRSIKIGMPRVLNMYALAPLFRTYFEALGVDLRHIIYSAQTDAKLWYRGSRRGSIDQCFPSKVAIAHIHNLIFDQKEHSKPDLIFFPIIRKMPGEIANAVDTAACPTVFITPEVVKAAYTKEGDVFADNGVRYVAPSIDMSDRNLLASQMYDCFRDILRITPEENREAMDLGFEAWRGFVDSMRSKARVVLDNLEKEGRVGVVMLGRPYHNDPGLNHEIMDEIQKKGYPIFSIESLPQDEDILDRLFGDEVEAGTITEALDITDVWKNAYSENSSKKVWGAKYVARHPNLVAVDISSFKCGHDSPIFDPIEKIIEATGTPYFTFHDVDENKPTGSINIRVETIDYFLQRYQEHLQRKRNAGDEVAGMVDAYKEHLRRLNAKASLGLEEPVVAGRVGVSGNGGGHGPAHVKNGSAPVFARWRQSLDEDGSERPVTDLSTNLAQTALNGLSTDASRYDDIRARSRADIRLEDEIANDALSCAVPTRDHALGAFNGVDEASGPVLAGAINARFVLPVHIQQMLGKPKPKIASDDAPGEMAEQKTLQEIAGD